MSIMLILSFIFRCYELNSAPDCVRPQPSEDFCHSRLAGLTPSLFQFPLGLIFSFFWSSWHGVSFRFSVTYCFTWLGAYGSFIPFSISGFGSRILSLVFTVFLCICQRSTVHCFDIVLLILSSGSSSLCLVQ